MTFGNSILAGVTLVREAIQSQNYAAGTSGWTVNADGSAEFADLSIRSSDGSGATVEVENGRAIFTAANGWKIVIDPTNTLPIIYFLDGQGDEAAAINATGDNARVGLNVSSGPFTDGAVTDWRWINFLGETSAGDRAQIFRGRDSDPTIFLGGWLHLDNNTAQIGVVDSEDSTFNTLLQAENHVFTLSGGRLLVSPVASASPALWVNVTATGYTGSLLNLQREGSGKFSVDKDGNALAAGTFGANGNITSGASVVADNIRRGTAQTPAPGGVPAQTSVAVTFADAMNGTPSVTVTPNSSAANLNTTNIRWAVTGVSSTGFTINCWRDTNAATNFEYVAIAP